MSNIKIWFPEFFTEAHRKPEEGKVLVEELTKFGVECQLDLTEDCSFIFCGSTWKAELVRKEAIRFPKIPIIHYNWDLYPFQLIEIEGYTRADPGIWDPYLEDLKVCRDIWVPSYCTVIRTREFTKRNAYIVKTSIRPWEPITLSQGDYAVDVIRKYPDPNRDAARINCKAVRVPLYESCNSLEWDKFREVISGCRFMVSPQFEASTGGLTLLEGYWHGKPSLISNSPRHGGIDYFGDKATYFQWDNPILFREALLKMYNNPPVINIDKARDWITQEYSETAMAKRMAKRFWELYNDAN